MQVEFLVLVLETESRREDFFLFYSWYNHSIVPIQGGFLLDAMLPIKQFEVGMLTDMPKSKYGLSNAFKVTVTSQQLFKGGWTKFGSTFDLMLWLFQWLKLSKRFD